ncbi:ABC transporter family C protein ABCC2 [Operophtera brumata]|uniref:ABC transporter family C protein ABCC2 n=1 Tax=Operophtera brumata TaxID=104452 RepID=A0A0L7LTN0_OPEBR|nr:ABC transporter family C protein ABCC2 [Operophtera brumata]
MEIAGNLEGCQLMCDGQIQDKIDELKKKREQLLELKDRVIECQCKLPVDVAVEVKRTVSLVALCRCTSEEKLMESCSCTSLRGTLLSNLLGDLFSGLQTELGGTGTQMPCQLLKCLEDQHNWDRASIVKSNLKDYFGQLLIGELDIAVGTSIEKYHAKWVGLSCADTARMKQDPGEDESDGWQKRAIERRAQKLATKLAEQLFQDRANELTQRAKDGDLSGCKDTAVYSMLVQPTTLAHVDGRTTPANTPTYWQQTMQGVTQLRVQIEDLKKDSIKKEDLKLMEEKITNCVQRGSGIGKTDIQGEDLFIPNAANDKIDKKEQKINRAVNLSNYYVNPNKPVNPKKKQIESNSKKGQKSNMNHFNGSDKTFKSMKKHGQTYAINMCMCSQRDPNKIALQNKSPNHSVIEEGKGGYRKDRASKDSILKSSSVKQTKPINSSLKSQDISTRSLSPKQQSCKSNCICFHKVPSNTSIDKLLETLAKWKSGLNPFKTEKESENEIRCCDFIPEGEINELNNRKQMQNDLSMPIYCTKDTTIAKQKSILSSSLGTIKNVNKASNAVEQTVNNDIISGKASNFVDETGQISSFQNCYCDKPSSIITKINAKTPSEMDKEKKSKDINNNKNANANVDASLKSRASNVRKEKSNLSKDVSCDSKSNPTNMNTVSIAPEITESEYMGAINLDKSNEDFCRCVNSMLECDSKSLTTKIEKIIQGNKSDIMSLGEPQQQKKSQTKANDSQKNSSSAMLQSLQSKSDDIKKKEKELFPCDCGYDIQFLGVTVTDMSFENAEKEEKLEASNIGGKNETNYKEDIGENKTNKNKEIFLNINNAGCEEFSTKLKQKASISDTIIEPNIIDEVKIVEKDKKTMDCHNKSCKRMASSDNKQNEFKNDIGDAFQNQPTNKDKGHDVQSFKDNKSEEESCVCCDKQKGDDSKDLEENTFHLLEQHLKNKLEKFKNLASCNSTCIPPEEEEKLFSTILKRVKKIIRDSTNQITCKCSNEEDNSGGSWKRAYGLLQEYLKTKIKRVQCSCVLAEDNKDTILPEVLEKVCNLIEHDFQRLNDVCTCKTSKLQVNKDSRPVYFKDEVPERDTDFFNIQNNAVHTTMNSCCSQNPQTSAIFKENISTQVAATLGMETKSCNPLETHTMNVQTLGKTQESFKTFELSQGCNYFDKKPDAELLCTNGIENMKSEESSSKTFSHRPYIGYGLECMCKNNECTNNTIPVIDNDNTALVNDVHKLITGKNGSENRTSIKNADAELLVANETKTNQLSDPVKNDCIYKPINSSPYCPMNENAKKGDYNSENIAHFQNKPYIGITIDCSCDTAVGACVCPKSVLQVDTGVMDSIMKKSMPNDEFYEKVSYILKSNPTETAHNYQTYLMPEMTGDLYLHNVLEEKTLCLDDSKQDCGIDTSLCDGEELIIKKSREHFETAHTTTNTFDDNTSFENNELPLDWCECCSHMLSRDLNRDQLKKSVYFPDNDIKTDNKVSVSKYCDCDMVPMCHVKMLVKNIENKLVSAKCTCDSMTPEVCPIHCTKC